MSDAQTLVALQSVVRRESSTRLQYMADAFPWTSAAGVEAIDKLRRIVQADRAAISNIAQFLARSRYPVAGTPSYPAGFTTLNFLSLAHLIPLLVTDVTGSIAYLEKVIPPTSGEGKALLETLLAGKKQHLAQLHALVVGSTTPAAS